MSSWNILPIFKPSLSTRTGNQSKAPPKPPVGNDRLTLRPLSRGNPFWVISRLLMLPVIPSGPRSSDGSDGRPKLSDAVPMVASAVPGSLLKLNTTLLAESLT